LLSKMSLNEEEKSKMALRYLKEREAGKIKLAETRIQQEHQKEINNNLKKDVEELRSKLTNLEAAHQKKIEELLSQQRNTIEHGINQATQNIHNQLHLESDRLRVENERLKNMTKETVTQMKNAIQREKDNFGNLKSAYESLTSKNRDLEFVRVRELNLNQTHNS
jgi:exonuclease VII large subunit